MDSWPSFQPFRTLCQHIITVSNLAPSLSFSPGPAPRNFFAIEKERFMIREDEGLYHIRPAKKRLSEMGGQAAPTDG